MECEYCISGRPHPVFVLLISDRRWWSATVQTTDHLSRASHWEVDAQPVLLLGSYNRDKRLVVGPKVSRVIAPHHQITLLIGGFASQRSARAFVGTISSSSRKFNNRLVRGICLAQAWHKVDPQQAQPLRIACPNADYIQRIRSLCRATKAAHATGLARQMAQLLAAAERALLS